jgi:hypothetical protein
MPNKSVIWSCNVCGKEFMEGDDDERGISAYDLAKACEDQGMPNFIYNIGQEFPETPHEPSFRIVDLIVMRGQGGKHIPQVICQRVRGGEVVGDDFILFQSAISKRALAIIARRKSRRKES